jgi:hypothetical protein
MDECGASVMHIGLAGGAVANTATGTTCWYSRVWLRCDGGSNVGHEGEGTRQAGGTER